MDSKQKPNNTALYENLATKKKLPSQFEVQGSIINDAIFMPGSTMTWKEQAQAYASLATRYGDELDEAKERLKLTELAYWLEAMDSE